MYCWCMMYEAWYNLDVSWKSKMGCVLKNLGCCSWENGNIFSSDDSGFDRTFNTFLHLSFPEKSGRSIEEIFLIVSLLVYRCWKDLPCPTLSFSFYLMIRGTPSSWFPNILNENDRNFDDTTRLLHITLYFR